MHTQTAFAFHTRMPGDQSRPIAIGETRSELTVSRDPIHEIAEEIACASRSDASVLIAGESGVGKKVVARLIHGQSHRRASPLMTINCASVPDSHLESAMFGQEGSANSHNMGYLEQADGSTLFIDEIGEMHPRVQALLLRFLEDRQIHGSNGVRSTVDVRIIAASSADLRARMSVGTFLEDLYYRLNIIHIPIPPLRERREDIPALFSSFVRLYSRQNCVQEPAISKEAVGQLISYDWPGNVRELKTAAERIVLRSRSAVTAADLVRVISESSGPRGEIPS